jgi:hypothetical protein
LDFLQQVLASSIGTVLAAIGTLVAYRYYVKRIFKKYHHLFQQEEANLIERMKSEGVEWDARTD